MRTMNHNQNDDNNDNHDIVLYDIVRNILIHTNYIIIVVIMLIHNDE